MAFVKAASRAVRIFGGCNFWTQMRKVAGRVQLSDLDGHLDTDLRLCGQLAIQQGLG